MNIFGLGTPELILIAFVFLLFFGKKRLPGLAQSIGQSIKELRDGLSRGFEESDKESKGK
ncbi:twin-arginine translocase TatA/TatE family subunit [Bradyrhizobium sediminis]|uniref:Sec-independent protein translocase protein TatA n=1 Tax=Bradyrhizobium sediminis TaxID=2840469 RepID=A0A975P0H3_9BRAD|nr:twin-arginine translocase TatA/TatE family subunit [Bradyrhizobium sediminis]